MAYKLLSSEEYAQADAGLREARLALDDREAKLMAVYNQVETGMSLIGATAVEDRWVDSQLRVNSQAVSQVAPYGPWSQRSALNRGIGAVLDTAILSRRTAH